MRDVLFISWSAEAAFITNDKSETLLWICPFLCHMTLDDAALYIGQCGDKSFDQSVIVS